MILASILVVVGMQAAGETPIAIQPDEPKKWEVEYPYIMSPYVDDYRNCLTSAVRTIGDNVPFEIQHLADIPRCSKVAVEAASDSNAALAKSKWSDEITPEDVDRIFETIRLIHIERGRDLDAQIHMRLAVNPAYREGATSAPATAKMGERLRRETEPLGSENVEDDSHPSTDNRNPVQGSK